MCFRYGLCIVLVSQANTSSYSKCFIPASSIKLPFYILKQMYMVHSSTWSLRLLKDSLLFLVNNRVGKMNNFKHLLISKVLVHIYYE